MTVLGKSFLDLVNACDSFPYTIPSNEPEVARLSQFYVETDFLGYLRAPVVNQLQRDCPRTFKFLPCSDGTFKVTIQNRTREYLTVLLNSVAQAWREADIFAVLKGWRDEQYTIYGNQGNILFTLERAACSLFGLVTYGAHLNAFIPATDKDPIRMWCPRRAMNKATYPGMLDNSVAGGISNGLSAHETIIKEAGEEASIPENVARKSIRSVGVISYIYVDGTLESGAGHIQPEVQYLYDLPLTGENINLKLSPNDGESQDFELWPMERVKEEMLRGNFKPNCAAVLVDFMIRHGVITPENDSDYIALGQRLHRTFPFPVW